MIRVPDEMVTAFCDADKAIRRAEFEQLGFNLHLPTLNGKALLGGIGAVLATIADDVRTVLAHPTTHNHSFPWRDLSAPCELCAARARLTQIFTDQDGGS